MANVLEDLSEAEFLSMLLASDNRAWRMFVARYRKLIFSKIHRVLARFPGVSRRVDADDVYASLMTSLLRNDMQKLRAFDIERGYPLQTWIMMLAVHLTFDHVRAAARRPEDAGVLDVALTEGNEVDALRRLVARDDWATVLYAIERLPSRDRELVERLFFEDTSPEEIALSMGISIKTVYTKKHKIRARFEEQRVRAALIRGPVSTLPPPMRSVTPEPREVEASVSEQLPKAVMRL